MGRPQASLQSPGWSPGPGARERREAGEPHAQPTAGTATGSSSGPGSLGLCLTPGAPVPARVTVTGRGLAMWRWWWWGGVPQFPGLRCEAPVAGDPSTGTRVAEAASFPTCCLPPPTPCSHRPRRGPGAAGYARPWGGVRGLSASRTRGNPARRSPAPENRLSPFRTKPRGAPGAAMRAGEPIGSPAAATRMRQTDVRSPGFLRGRG